MRNMFLGLFKKKICMEDRSKRVKLSPTRGITVNRVFKKKESQQPDRVDIYDIAIDLRTPLEIIIKIARQVDSSIEDDTRNISARVAEYVKEQITAMKNND